MPRSIPSLVLLGGLLLLPLAPARAQIESREGIALQNQIYELRHELDSIQRQLGNGAGGGSLLGGAGTSAATKPAKGGSDILPQLVDRVSTLEDEVRDLRGKLEELENTVSTQNANLNKALDDLRFRLDQMQGGKGAELGTGAAAGAAAGAATAAVAGQAQGAGGTGEGLSPPPRPLGTLPAGPEEKKGESAAASTPSAAAPPAPPKAATLLAEATTALGRKDYPAAENAAAAAEQAAKAAKNAHDLVEARLLLARAYYGEHQYQKAALSYDDAYKVAPKGPRAPDALLGLAQALIALDAKPAACDALNRLAREFPQARPAQERAALLRQRAACG
jgi:TolA-binding protein